MVELMGNHEASIQRDHTGAQSSEGRIFRLCRSPLRRHRRASGFTLLETVAAISILAIGTLGVAASMLTSMKMGRESRVRTQAIYLAEQQMEIFRVMTTAEITAALANPLEPGDTASIVDPDPNDDDPTTFTRTWEIVPNDPETGMFNLTVVVGFTDKMGVLRTERLQSLKAAL
jgi:prepilin-type N-terminal cleavage/methylation domain-containing protein